jgi:L-ascorbate metabolism protein UlaG (beta-lactamase superfamily)
MKIQYFGHSCFALRYEGGPVLVTDPFDASVTYPPCRIECDAALVSHDHFDHNHTATLSGEFETIKTRSCVKANPYHFTLAWFEEKVSHYDNFASFIAEVEEERKSAEIVQLASAVNE